MSIFFFISVKLFINLIFHELLETTLHVLAAFSTYNYMSCVKELILAVSMCVGESMCV